MYFNANVVSSWSRLTSTCLCDMQWETRTYLVCWCDRNNANRNVSFTKRYLSLRFDFHKLLFSQLLCTLTQRFVYSSVRILTLHWHHEVRWCKGFLRRGSDLRNLQVKGNGSDRTDFTWTQVSAVLLFLIGMQCLDQTQRQVYIIYHEVLIHGWYFPWGTGRVVVEVRRDLECLRWAWGKKRWTPRDQLQLMAFQWGDYHMELVVDPDPVRKFTGFLKCHSQ